MGNMGIMRRLNVWMAVVLVAAMCLLVAGLRETRGQERPGGGGGGSAAPGQGVASSTNIVSVSKSGNDATGARGGSPFLTIPAAKGVALAGDTIVVYPGTYTNTDMLKAGVNYYFYPGSAVWFFETNASGTGGYGLFDDRSSGATTNIIGGYGKFTYCCGTNQIIGGGADSYIGNTNTLGLFVLTNSASRVNFHFDTCYFGDFSVDEGACFQVINCSYCAIEGVECFDLFLTPITIQGSLQHSTAIGFNWVYGEEYVHMKHVGMFNQYSVWPNEACTQFAIDVFPAIAQQPVSNATNNFWFTADFIQGTCYCLELSTNMRTWWDVKEVDVGTNGSTGRAFEMDGTGKHYIRVEKLIGGSGSALAMGGGSSSNPNDNQVWLNCQKMSGANGFYTFTQGTLYANVLQYEDLGMVASTAGVSDVSTSGRYYLNGGLMTTISNGLAVSMSGAGSILALNGLTIDSSAGTNYPINVASAGLSLQNVKLTSSNTVPCIFASSGQTVTNEGYLAYNVIPSVNITLTGQSPNPVVNTGTTNATALSSFTATFTKQFVDTKYTAVAFGNGVALAAQSVSSKTTSNCVFNMTAATGNIDWIATHR